MELLTPAAAALAMLETPSTPVALKPASLKIAMWPAQTINTTTWDAVSNAELKVRATPRKDSQMVAKLPPGTRVSVVAESLLKDGTRRAKVAFQKEHGETKRGWVSWSFLGDKDLPARVKQASKVNSPTVSRDSSTSSMRRGSVNYKEFLDSFKDSSTRSMRPPSKNRSECNFPITLMSDAADDDSPDSSFAYRPGWSKRSEELRQMVDKNVGNYYRSEDVLPSKVDLTGDDRLPVHASFKNRSDRKIFRLESVISTAKAHIAMAEGGHRRMSHEAMGPESYSTPLPDRKQRQHVLRHRLWRSHKLGLGQVNEKLLSASYHNQYAQWDPLEA